MAHGKIETDYTEDYIASTFILVSTFSLNLLWKLNIFMQNGKTMLDKYLTCPTFRNLSEFLT